jgi:BTB/POZ domain-containing protein KCTD9
MNDNNQGIEELKKSFGRVYDGANRLQREYDLVKEAQKLDIPFEIYRHLYELRQEEHIEPYPKPKHWQETPGKWSEWFIRLPKNKKLFLFRKGIIKLVQSGVAITAIVGLVNYIIEVPKRQKQSHYQAWQIINSAVGQQGNGGRIEALQDLNSDGVNLQGLTVIDANLSGINLKKANLAYANFQKNTIQQANLQEAKLYYANLQKAYFYETNLQGANLQGANLQEANLWKANLQGADLWKANLRGANLQGANLETTQNLTPEQIRAAVNWDKAKYSPQFSQKLGLLPETPTSITDKKGKP